MKLFFVLVLVQLSLLFAHNKVIEEYVNRPDNTYKYNLHSTVNATNGRMYVLNVTSQTWLTTNEVSKPVWKHWVLVIIPRIITSFEPLVFIRGSNSDMKAPTTIPKDYAAAASITQSIIIVIHQVPNQPVSFPSEPRPRKEDDIIAYTWKIFLNTKKTDWIQQLPMVKGAVKCIDSAKDFLFKTLRIKVDKYVVTGASKRGWTTWLVAIARPQEIAAIIPIVIPVLNMTENFKQIYKSYCFWPAALKDYEREGIMKRMYTPEMQDLQKIVDPINYLDILKMPKYIVSASGDQFFVPDSSDLFMNHLKGENRLRYIPNSDHGMKGTDAFESIISTYHSYINRVSRPEFKWENKFDAEKGELTLYSSEKPESVKLWYAINEKHRNFMVKAIGKVWKSENLIDQGNGKYSAKVNNPSIGYKAYMIEVKYKSKTLVPMIFTTSVYVVPNKYPCSNPFKLQK
eukprot:gene11860-5189_t